MCQVHYVTQVLQSDGGNYCASINAATLALVDAGIPMKDLVCACSASFVKETPVVDINHMEENHAGCEVAPADITPRYSHWIIPNNLLIVVSGCYGDPAKVRPDSVPTSQWAAP